MPHPRCRAFFPAFLVVLLLLPAAARAADGDPDSTFNATGSHPGVYTRDLSADYNDGSNDVVILDSGAILAAGVANQTSIVDNGAVLVRLLAEGEPDTSFGTDGIALYEYGAADNKTSFQALGLQSDGRIVAAGRYWDGTDTYMALTRAGSDGTQDATFGTSGGGWTFESIDPSAGSTRANDLHVLGDDTILAVGRTKDTHERMFLARFDADGALDASFGATGSGYTVSDLDGDTDVRAQAVAVDAQGRILVAGSATGSGQRLFLARFTADGALDDTYGAGGILFMGAVAEAWVTGLGVFSDGSCVLSAVEGADGGDETATVWRADASGDLVQSFGTSGRFALPDPAGYDHTSSGGCLAEPFGRITVAGSAHNASSTRVMIFRLTPDGSLDTSFGTDGVSIPAPDYPAYQGTGARALTTDADYNLVLAGAVYDGSDEITYLARIESTPVLLGGSSSGGCISGQSLSAAMLVLLAVGLAVVKLVVRFRK
jgi:uncharacterized delta-60 repeat protein